MAMGRNRRARRAVLLGLALFVLTQSALVPATVLEWLPLRDPDHAQKMRLLERRLPKRAGQARPLSVVQIGSSRTVYGLRGQVAEPCLERRVGRPVVLFNMGFHGAGPVLNRLNLERLFRGGVRPDLVLVEVLPVLLTNQPLISELMPSRVSASRLGHEELPLMEHLAARERPHLSREWWSCQVMPLSTYRFSILSALAPNFLALKVRTNNYVGADASGWVPLPRRPPAVEREALAFAEFEYRRGLQFFQLSPRILAAVRETVQRCAEEGVPAALVVMPEGPAFQSWYAPGVWEQIRAALTGLSRECGAPFIDLHDSVAEDGFIDSHHLYPDGASRYTMALARRLVPLLRSRKSPAPSSPLAMEERLR
jgi:hypothetical protein